MPIEADEAAAAAILEAYLGMLARLSSKDMSSGGWIILLEAEVVAIKAGFFSCESPYAGKVGLPPEVVVAEAPAGNSGLDGCPFGPVG